MRISAVLGRAANSLTALALARASSSWTLFIADDERRVASLAGRSSGPVQGFNPRLAPAAKKQGQAWLQKKPRCVAGLRGRIEG